MEKELLDKGAYDLRPRAKLPADWQSVLPSRRNVGTYTGKPQTIARSSLRSGFRQHTTARLKAARPPAQLALFWKALIGVSLLIAISSSAFTVYHLTSRQSAAPQLPQQLTQQQPIALPTQATTNHQSAQPSIASVSNPTQAAAKMSEPVYLPTGLPGYSVNNDVQVLSNKTVDYSITDSNKATYYVAQQPILPTFNLNDFAKNLTGVENVPTPAGTAIIGNNHSELIASIRTPQNLWILISATNTNLKPQLEAIVKSLKATSS